MSKVLWFAVLGLAGSLAAAPRAEGQTTPYIGFVYPAGGQQGAVVRVKLGGQRLDGVQGVLVSGAGVSAKLVELHRQLNAQEMSLLREQLRELTRAARWARGRRKTPGKRDLAGLDEASKELVARIDQRIAEYVPRPACASLSSIAYAEVALAPDAAPGQREIRLTTPRGVSNPLAFHVGQTPETVRKPLPTSPFQVLGKEELAQRVRPEDEVEVVITTPCTMNGQIAPGEVNRYRFEARKGQRLVIAVAARQLIPYIADAVPGWFQAVLSLADANGKEVAYNDDFRFQPDPVLFYQPPEDGQYVLSITDAIYRGREDFVYRITIGELPFVTSIFPLGCRVGEPAAIEMTGWNLDRAKLAPPPDDAEPGVRLIAARNRRFVSNRVPFELDTLPEGRDQESNNQPSQAQKAQPPVIVNGRIDRPGDWDVYQITGKAGDRIVAEVRARRLDSPLDSLLKITDGAGRVLAFNDDHEDVGSGLNTHHADSYLMFELPADGDYYVHLGDAARSGGNEYAYRLRISEPRPDFALRVAPSSLGMRDRASAPLSVFAIRKDGFAGEIKLSLKDPPPGFSSNTVTLAADKDMARLPVRAGRASAERPVSLAVKGVAVVQQQRIVREAVPAEDRMQAFLWRHLVPAQDLLALAHDPSNQPPPARVAPLLTEELKAKYATQDSTEKPKFTQRQVAGRLRQLQNLYEEWLLTDDFYQRKVAECEAAQ